MEQMGVVSGTNYGLLISLVLAVPILILRWRYIEETVKENRGTVIQPTSAHFSIVTQIRAIPFEIWKLIVVAFFSCFGFQIFWSFVAVYCVEEVGLSMLEWSYVSIIANLVAACFMIPSGFISDRIGRKKIVSISQFVVSLTSLGYVFSTGFSGVALTRLLGGVGEGLGGNVFGSVGGPVWQALVTENAPVEMRGSVLGLMGTLTGLFSAPAPIVGGYLYDNVSPQLPFLASFFIGIIGCLIFTLWVKEPRALRHQ
jgi:MFS family permease